MLVKDIMTTHVETIAEDATVREAAEAMRAKNIGFLPVINEGVGVGVITDRDIIVRVVAQGLDPQKTYVGEVMTTGLPHPGHVETHMTTGLENISQDAEAEEALQLMKDHHLRRLLVHGDNYEIVGVLSLADLTAATEGK